MRRALSVLCFMLAGCGGRAGTREVMTSHKSSTDSAGAAQGSFADDLAFLRRHSKLIVLQSADGRAQVIVAPEYQGRVLTSTASGGPGPSFGFINREVIASGQ